MSLLSGNDQLWHQLYQITATINDRIILTLLLIGTITGILCGLLCKGTAGIVAVAMSVNYGVMRVPVIHTKLSFALQTVSSVIANSTSYANEFQAITHCETVSQYQIISSIYQVRDETLKQSLLNSSAGKLYQGYFHAEERITSFLGVPLTNEIPMVVFMMFIITFMLLKKENKISLILVIAILLVYTCFITKDCTIGTICFLFSALCVRHTTYTCKNELLRRKKG